jgi:cell division protein FtsA
MKEKEHRLAAVDLGSTKTRIAIAELVEEVDGVSPLRFLGLGEAESVGWRKGTISDLDEVTLAVKEASERAEKASGVPVESAVVGVGGPHVQGASTGCGLTLSLRPRKLTRHDVRRVMETARDVPLSRDREILHLVPKEFVLDAQHGIHEPIGLEASYLGVEAQIISGSVTATRNVVTAVNRAGIVVEATVFEALAAGEEVLSDEERELGALVVDLGGGSSELVAYHKGGLRVASVIPIGGDHFTNDIAVGLQTPFSDAELLKRTMGSVLSSQCSVTALVEIPGIGDRPARFVPHRMLAEILESRAEELLDLILADLRHANLEGNLEAGVVLCGGGAHLGGMCDLAEQVLGAPARLGLPPKMVDMPPEIELPEYATLVGLLFYAQRLSKLRASAQDPNLATPWKRFIAGKR